MANSNKNDSGDSSKNNNDKDNSKKNDSDDNSKKKKKRCDIPKDHPLIRAGFLPEPMLLEVWQFGEGYFRHWLRENSVPYRLIDNVRWFHVRQLEAWFGLPGGSSDPGPGSQNET